MSNAALIDLFIWFLLILFCWSCITALALAIFHCAVKGPTSKRDDE